MGVAKRSLSKAQLIMRLCQSHSLCFVFCFFAFDYFISLSNQTISISSLLCSKKPSTRGTFSRKFPALFLWDHPKALSELPVTIRNHSATSICTFPHQKKSTSILLWEPGFLLYKNTDIYVFLSRR